MIPLLLSLILAIPVPPVPPVLPIPDDLEICMLKAELCAARAAQPVCHAVNIPALEQCTTDYEDCAWWIDEMHIIGCRQSHTTCALEVPLYPKEQWFQEFCANVDKVCPVI